MTVPFFTLALFVLVAFGPEILAGVFVILAGSAVFFTVVVFLANLGLKLWDKR